MRLARLRSGWRAVAGLVGAGEVLLALGLVLVTVALWPGLGRLALLPAGLVLVWLALPARTVFVMPSADKPRRAA